MGCVARGAPAGALSAGQGAGPGRGNAGQAPVQTGGRKPAMSRTLSIDLLAYALFLTGLSVLAQRLAPAFGMTSVITGIVGGALLASCAVLAIRGHPRQRWALLTLVVLAVVLLAQAVSAWIAVRGGRGRSEACGDDSHAVAAVHPCSGFQHLARKTVPLTTVSSQTGRASREPPVHR
jgi:hypothetical protein